MCVWRGGGKGGVRQGENITNSRQDNQGISSLKDSADYMLYDQNIKTANLLNKQFQSVFTCLSPLRLVQLSTQTIQSLFHDILPDDLKSSCPSMPKINVDLNGVLKFLLKVNPGKAAGPDSVKHIVLLL